MNTRLETLFCENLHIEEEINAFLAQDPKLAQAEQEFYETAHEIAGLAGFELYDLFERRLGAYLNRLSDLYYLFELGLRQDILQGMDRQSPTPLPL